LFVWDFKKLVKKYLFINEVSTEVNENKNDSAIGCSIKTPVPTITIFLPLKS